MSESNGEPKLFFPALRPFYDFLQPLSWLNRGYEFVLLWGLMSLAIWWRGGGPYSLDRKIGREL